MGVDMGIYDDLIAHHQSVEQINSHIGSDSLHYLSMAGMMRAVGRKGGYCQGCFSGEYPIPVDRAYTKTGFEKTA